MNGPKEDIAFIIRFGAKSSIAAFHERAERARGSFVPVEPCRGSDSGSNPDSGALFLLSFDQRSCSAQGKKCKLECKLSSKHDHISKSDLALVFTLAVSSSSDIVCCKQQRGCRVPVSCRLYKAGDGLLAQRLNLCFY